MLEIPGGNMDLDLILGCVVAAAALGFLTVLVLWSRRSIDRIAEKGYKSFREIMKGLRDGE